MRQSSTRGQSASAESADLALRLRRDEHPRQAVVDDEGELGRGQIRIDAGVVEPRALAGGAALDEARVVLHEDGVVIEAPEAKGAQEMRQTVAARLEVAIADGLPRSRHHDGRLIRARVRVLARIHARAPTGRVLSSDDAAPPPLPVPFAQRPLIELAGRQAWRPSPLFGPAAPGKSRLPQRLQVVEARALRRQRLSVAIRLSTPTGEMRTRPE